MKTLYYPVLKALLGLPLAIELVLTLRGTTVINLFPTLSRRTLPSLKVW